MEYFSNRRTIRNYKPKKVADSLIDSIIESAAKAPTCGNMQLYSVVVTKDDAGKKALAPLHFNQPMIEGCSHVLTICADYNRFARWCEVNHTDPGCDNILSFINAMTDAVIFAQQIVTIAEMNGLGTCYLGTVSYNAAQIAEALRLPEMVIPVACVTVGYPDDKGEETERLGLDAIRFDGTYPELTDDDIRDLYREKEAYEPNKKYVEENGKDNLAQVFAEVRYPRAMNEEFSASFIEFLKKQRFL